MIPMKDIRAFAHRIAAEFKPQRIILFGSYAYGEPRPGSDVDLLLEMTYRGHPISVASTILRRLNPTLPVDLIVSSPREVRARVAEHDWFMMDIVEKGKLLYESRNA